jgi:hypothetical protein
MAVGAEGGTAGALRQRVALNRAEFHYTIQYLPYVLTVVVCTFNILGAKI